MCTTVGGSFSESPREVRRTSRIGENKDVLVEKNGKQKAAADSNIFDVVEYMRRGAAARHDQVIVVIVAASVVAQAERNLDTGSSFRGANWPVRSVALVAIKFGVPSSERRADCSRPPIGSELETILAGREGL